MYYAMNDSVFEKNTKRISHVTDSTRYTREVSLQRSAVIESQGHIIHRTMLTQVIKSNDEFGAFQI